MDEIQEQNQDKYWLYVGLTIFVIVAGIMMVKQSENKKYEPIQQQIDAENAAMNIRVISDK
jgi:hypothetical protein